MSPNREAGRAKNVYENGRHILKIEGTERRGAVVTLGSHAVIELLTTTAQLLLPEDCHLTGAAHWAFERDALILKVSGRNLPVVSDGVELPALWLEWRNWDEGRELVAEML